MRKQQERSELAGAEADGQVTTAPGTVPLVLVADCLPVVLSGEGPAGSGPRHLAVIHCGWRPLAAGILGRAVAATGAEAAAIGPGIGPCCYEVGEDVRESFAALERSGEGPGTVFHGRSLDLAEVAERQLREAGVGQIERAGLCTSCRQDLFYSHRRDAGETGRQAGLALFDGAR